MEQLQPKNQESKEMFRADALNEGLMLVAGSSLDEFNKEKAKHILIEIFEENEEPSKIIAGFQRRFSDEITVSQNNADSQRAKTDTLHAIAEMLCAYGPKMM